MTEPRRSQRPAERRKETAITDPNDRLAQLEARLEQLEREPSLRERGRGLMARVMPPEASRHFRNAGREQLLGMRAIVDHWIRRIDESEKAASGNRRESIEVE
jgi:hypothetical protein